MTIYQLGSRGVGKGRGEVESEAVRSRGAEAGSRLSIEGQEHVGFVRDSRLERAVQPFRIPQARLAGL